MLRIRLTRVGKRNSAHYRVVVAEHSRPVNGKFLELLGTYSPTKKDLALKEERIKYWISQGAAPSQTVARLLRKNGYEGMDKFIKFIVFPEKKQEEASAA